MYRKLASALLVAGAITSQSAAAVSLGEITMNSALNEPLDAVIKLTNTKDFDASQILVKLAAADEFDKAGIERTFFLSDIKFTVEVDGSGNGYVHLTSERRVNEPFLDILLEGRWPTGRMLRSYTVLVDLPVYKDAPAVAIDKGSEKERRLERVDDATEQQRSTSTEASASPAQRPESNQIDRHLKEDEYFTQKNDTLWVIAQRHTAGTDLGVNQTMTAIQQYNPHAFINNNVNLLKQGVVLRLPDEQAIREINQQQAVQAVAQQEKEWRDAQIDNKKQQEESDEKLAQSDTRGHLSLTSAGAGIVAGEDESGELIEGLQEQLRAVQDEVAASQLESQELNSRVSTLDAQIDQLKRLIELKDAELAALQQKMGRDTEAVSSETTRLEASQKTAQEAEAEKLKLAEADSTEKKEVKPVLKDKPAKPVEQKDSKLVKEQPTAKKEVKTKDADAQIGKTTDSKTSFTLIEKVQQNPIYIGLLGLLVMLGVVALLLRRRTEEESNYSTEVDDFIFDEELEDEVALEELDEDVEETQSIDDESELVTGEPVEEADVYLQFGRYDQAATILEKAIKAEPSNALVAAKLAETYLLANDEEACQELYQQLSAQEEQDAINAIDSYLENDERGVEWLEALKVAAPSLDGSVLDDLIETELDESSQDDVLIEYEKVELDDIEETLLDEVGELESELDLDADFDFKLDDLGEEQLETTQSEVVEEHSLDLDEEVDLIDDLDLDLSDFDLEVAESGDVDLASSGHDELDIGEALLELDGLADEGSEFTTTEQADSIDISSELDLGDFDLDLDLDEAIADSELAETTAQESEDLLADISLDEVASEPETTPVTDEAELSLDDFDLDFDEFSFDEEAEDGSAESSELFDLDLAELEESLLDEEALEVENAAQAEEQAVELDAVSAADFDSSELDFVDGIDEVATKLDLAQAYIDMGDIDGAKDLLDEVLEQGNEVQKQEANELLSQLN